MWSFIVVTAGSSEVHLDLRCALLEPRTASQSPRPAISIVKRSRSPVRDVEIAEPDLEHATVSGFIVVSH